MTDAATTKELRLAWAEVEEPLFQEEFFSMTAKFTLQDAFAEPCAAFLSPDGGSPNQPGSKRGDVGFGDRYDCLRAVFSFKREFGFHLIQTYFPTILLVVSSWVAFFIDPTAVPARISIGVTTVLTIISMLVAVRIGLPPVSYIKALPLFPLPSPSPALTFCRLWTFGCSCAFYTYLGSLKPFSRAKCFIRMKLMQGR